MSETTIPTRFQNAGHPSTAWAASNPILKAREPALETDTGKVKYGDGVKPWNDLPYFVGDPATLTALYHRSLYTELPFYTATLQAALTTYSYSYLYPQSFAIDHAEDEVVTMHCPAGGANLWTWFVLWDVTDPTAPIAITTFYYPTSAWRESVILRTIDGVRYLEFLDNFDLVRVDISTMPTDGAAVSAAATFAVDCFPWITYDPISDQYLAGNRGGGPGGRANKDRYVWRSGADPMVVTGEYRLPFIAAGSNRAGYVDLLPKAQGIALHRGAVVTGFGGIAITTDNGPPRACGLMLSSLDGQLLESALTRQTAARALMGQMTGRTISIVESEGVYTEDGKLYQLWATLTTDERESPLALTRGIVITHEMDPIGTDFSPDAFVPSNSFSKEDFERVCHASDVQLTDPIIAAPLNSFGDILDMMSNIGISRYSFYGFGQTLTDINGAAISVSGTIVTFTMAAGIICLVEINGNERWGRYWISDLNTTRVQALLGDQVTAGGNWWIGADNANNAINQVAGHRLQKDGTLISYRGGAGGATQYLGRSGDGGLVSYYRNGTYIGGHLASARGVDLVTSTGVIHGSCTGTPEGQITGNVGSTMTRKDGGAGTTFYVKESGTGNTGWVAK